MFDADKGSILPMYMPTALMTFEGFAALPEVK
jgi:hypothetical protein